MLGAVAWRARLSLLYLSIAFCLVGGELDHRSLGALIALRALKALSVISGSAIPMDTPSKPMYNAGVPGPRLDEHQDLSQEVPCK